MLTGLSIRDVVLIDRLDLQFEGGLTALTGETGAGKSILLDALGLALGGRGDAGLVRAGAGQAVVSAVFDLPARHALRTRLAEQGIDADNEVILRRVLGADGRSRAFVNDQPVAIGLLREIGREVIEVQGQFEQRGLIDPATHRGLLDDFGGPALAGGRLDAPIAALERAAAELTDAVAGLEALAGDDDLDPRRLEKIEERLFALRGLARKHRVEVAALPALRDQLALRLAAIEDRSGTLERLTREAAEARAAYVRSAEALSALRHEAAGRLDKGVAGELPPLKLERARFSTAVARTEEADWSEHGIDRVRFEAATNPGQPPGPLNRIASGGELSRFMLALKVVLARTDPVPTLVFDEVDSGIGGATADAVGERLARLAKDVQILVVTHSPQVAARAARQMRVTKSVARGDTMTRVEALAADDRREEIARMLSGAAVTDEARAAADRLIEDGARMRRRR